MADLSAVPFVFPDVTGQKVLILGLGGGCDIITAFAISKLLDIDQSQGVVYANTKTADVGSVEHVTAHILRVSGPVIESSRRVRGRGKAWIDHSVPRSPNGSPWIVLLDDEVAERELVGEFRSLELGVATFGRPPSGLGGKGVTAPVGGESPSSRQGRR